MPIRRSAWKDSSRNFAPRPAAIGSAADGPHRYPPMPRRAFSAPVERREVLEYWANNSVRGVPYGHFGDPTDGCTRTVLRCVPEPARFARELGETLRPVRGARPGGEARREATPWRVGFPHGGSWSRTGGSAGPRPGAWAGPPADRAPRHRCLGRTGSVPSGWRWSLRGTTYDERVSYV
jgi:Copper binding octapeptide repeat